jgi:sterol desaturase/sphingolipid hydroxylase (fatty acid hydroxylase superfamily)
MGSIKEGLYSECTNPDNAGLKNMVKNDTIRYKQKGFGLGVAILIASAHFLVLPRIVQNFWPTFNSVEELNLFYILCTTGTHSLTYIISNLVLYCLYVTKIPFFESYRVSNKPWPWEENTAKWRILLKKSLINNFLAQLVILPAFLYLDTLLGVKVRMDIESYPGPFEIISQILIWMVIEDFFFYWGHRILHTKFMYQKIHKIHHEYTNTVSTAAEYTHPLEYIMTNLVPAAMGAKIFGAKSHYITLWIWSIMRGLEAVDGHSGYEFSWSPFRLLPLSCSSMYHNYHHSHNVGNYGSFFTYWDTFQKTNVDYFKFLAKKERSEVSSLSKDQVTDDGKRQ